MIDVKEIMKNPETKRWHDVLGKYAKLSNYKNALDIGTASGLSAYTIAKNGKGMVYTVDIVRKNNVERFFEQMGIADRVVFTIMSSFGFVRGTTLMFDFISIDGSHWKKDVYSDAVEGWKHLNKKGYMIFDDYEAPSIKGHVQRAVGKFVNKNKLELIVDNGRAIIQKV